LTNGMYVSRDPNEAIGRMDIALEHVCAAEPVEKKLQHAVRSGQLPKTDPESLLAAAVKHGVISELEAEKVRLANQSRKDAIRVDDFAQDYWGKRASR